MLKDYGKDAIIASGRHVTYTEMLRRISLYGDVLLSNIPCGKGNRILIISENREGYIYAFFSVWLNGQIVVPVDFQSNEDELSYIINDCRPSAIWVSSSVLKKVKNTLDVNQMDVPVFVIDSYEKCVISGNIASADIKYERNNPAVIVYTSGTQGAPKGVILSFANLLTNVYFVSEEVPVCTPERRAVILLPLHHTFPLVATMLVPLLIGAGVAIAPSLSARDILNTMKTARIGMLVGVPKLWETLYNAFMMEINSTFISRMMYSLCRKVDSLSFSKLIFHRLHKSFGGHLKTCPSGGAALNPKIWKGMKILGIEIIEGYGMTECGPLISFNRPGESRAGCVGKPLSGCQVRIDEGEICVKGDNVMTGYYNRHADTDAVFDSEGWLHTGDLGYLDWDGYLYVTGRKKELIVLSNGKKISPEEIESNILQFTSVIKECAVFQKDDKLNIVIRPSLADDNSDRVLQIIVDSIIQYNKTVPVYKSLSNILITELPFPRTRMNKLKRHQIEEFSNSCKSLRNSSVPLIPEEMMDSLDFLTFQDHNSSIHKLKPMGKIGWLVVSSSKWISRWLFDLQFSYLENIPWDRSSFIMVSNHQSYLDALLLMQGFSKKQFSTMTFLAKEEHIPQGIIERLAKKHRVVILSRKNIFDAVDELKGNIIAGANALIFPEGTRTNDGTIGRFRPLFALLSRQLKIPVVPVCIKGAYQALPKHRKIPIRHGIKIVVLPPLYPDDFESEENLTSTTETLMKEELRRE